MDATTEGMIAKYAGEYRRHCIAMGRTFNIDVAVEYFVQDVVSQFKRNAKTHGESHATEYLVGEMEYDFKKWNEAAVAA